MVFASLSAVAVMKILLVTTVGIGASGCILAWRERPEPGAVPLAVLLAGQCYWSATLFFRLDARSLGGTLFWFDLSWLGIVCIPVAWFFFSLEYAGYSQYVKPRYVATLSVVPAVCGLLGVTNSFHHLVYADSVVVQTTGTMLVDRTPEIGFWVIAGYTYLLGLLGVIPLLKFVTSDLGTFRGQSLAILLGLFVPWVTNALFLLGLVPTGGVDPTPIAFSFSGIAYLGALMQFQLFGTSPAPIRPARRSVFSRMQEGAIVLDRHDNIVDINEHAMRALGHTPEETLGQPITSVIPEFDSIVEDRSTSGQAVVQSDDSRTYDISVNPLRDAHGRVTGRIVTLHDITDHLQQQQRLEVLNRVFRHNVRTNTQVIVGNVEYLANHNSEKKAAKVRQKAIEIENLSEKIRTVLDIFEQKREQAEPERLDEMLERCLVGVQKEYPEASIEYAYPSEKIYVDSMLKKVFLNIIENAVQHNTNDSPEVSLDVTTYSDRVAVTVRDNGPGIDREELSLIENRTETPLEHGSGFGLALAIWGTEFAGGEITFEENDPTGTVVTIDVPVLSSSDRNSAGSVPSGSALSTALTDRL